MLFRTLLALVLGLSTFLLGTSPAFAAPLLIDGSVAGPAVCPDGGTPVDASCQVNATASLNRGCRYGGTQTFDAITLQNGATLCVAPFDGTDKLNTGNLVLRSLSTISVDATSRITAKGTGYRARVCDNGEGPSTQPLSGGRGGCAVNDSGGGGAHFGGGGRGTKDCFIVAPATSCQFPQEWEENCGALNGAGNACVTIADPNNSVCYGTTNSSNGAGDGLPTVAGNPFRHSVYDVEFGAAGGDKGCRDGFDAAIRSGRGGGRIVLYAANASQTGAISIAGRIVADGHRGCSSGNDSAGGGAGGSVLIVGDQVEVLPTARVSAHGGRGGDSQPKCLPCSSNAQCQAGQTCQAGRCGPCNCTPCTSNAQCNSLLGQTCKNLGGDLGSVCADASNQCSPLDPGDDERECAGTQNNGTCDDCAGGGGGGIINVQSRLGDIHPEAIFDVRGAAGGICPICSGEAGGGAGELQIDSAYVGEICDGWDNDFDGMVDEGLGQTLCPDGTLIEACVGGVPQICDFSDASLCLVQASDARPRFTMIVDTSGSMLNDLSGNPTFGDGSADYPGVDTASDADAVAGNNSRLFIAKEALTQVLSAFPESDYALARYYQDVGVNRSCQSASNFECAASCCSYDDPSDNLPPPYPATYPGNTCVLSDIYPSAGYPATPAFDGNISIGWAPELAESPATSECINYAGSCGPPRRGAQVLVGFDRPINGYLRWLDGLEDADAGFDPSTVEGNHCATGDCELRGTGPTPLAGSLQATYDYLVPVVSCDSAKDCRSYSTILLTDGAESCDGDPVAAAAALSSGIAGKSVRTYVIGFSVLPSEQGQLNNIATAGGTGAAFFVSSKQQLANALAQIIGENQKFEVCNDLDDDCDNMIDEDFPEKGLPCNDGLLGVCAGTGAFVCKADGTGTECVITNPGGLPSAEICNGLDDDCDGLVDEDDLGLPLDCCVPMPEVCDGVSNDCDADIDEQDEIAINQPGVFGGTCGVLTAPNDQSPCQLGTVLCVNGGPLCVGFVGPKPEVCNGQDDDCDGISDNVGCPGDAACIEGQCLSPCAGGEFACPGGFECENGYCHPIGGEGGGGQGGSGGASQGGGGEGGVGGDEPSTTSTSTASTTGSSGAGGAGGDGEGGSGLAPAYGLATGGGGLSCSASTGPTEGGGFGFGGLLTLGAALAWRKRRARSAKEVA